MTATQLDIELARAAEVLEGAAKVALACHVNPDPDALGSALGLALFLAARGKEVVVSWGNEPFEHPTWLPALAASADGEDHATSGARRPEGQDGSTYGAMPGRNVVVPPADFPKEPAVMVALDTAALDRLGSLASTVDHAGEVIVLDHHRTNPGFGSVVVIDPEASSTAELVYRLVERMGGELPDRAAACLYAGIVTDTGRFQYEATTPETLRVAGELRKHDFDHAELGRILFEDAPLAYLRVAAVALERIQLVPEANLVWTYITQRDLSEAGAVMADTDDLIDLVRMTREADVGCVFKQQADGFFKVSLRSKGATDVGAVAQRFEGGGHRLAAGYTATESLDESVRQLLEALPAADA